ncbi:Cytochrome C oxidase, cbb3-type, subunit III [Nannocystis exedens]|uniref:Cytochrome C oxidase, cbb3-type, subunit III n=1 Tax=Nannocystis exedens TaxID=54 RepID=A0A1I2H7S7_9BACT|nr:cytochrome c [Nannocystis exedens]PCC73995.1 Cytochrome c [Nannocystis exedens]SFF24816.1 Cytochrome C oxidase, cbb3-type, subunit III [Nannocystis exedens]
MRTLSTRPTPLTLACLLVTALFTGCTKRGSQDPADPEQAPGPAEQKIAGATLFEKHCAKCHGALGKGKDGVPAVVGEEALARFATAQEVFEFIRKEMPQDKPGSLAEGEYWAIVAFDLKANGIDADETVGPQNASTFMLHAEGDKADDKQDAAEGDRTDDRVSPDVNE